MKTLKFIAWIALGLILVGVGALLLVNQKFIWGSLFIIVGSWILMSIKIIGPSEMAVFVWLGDPIGFRDSGPRFILWLFGKLKRYPKKMYNFNYTEREVITKADEKAGIGAQKLMVDAVAYLNFPREIDIDANGKAIGTHPLIKILRAEVPVKDTELKDWTEEAVVGALRLAFGQLTWTKTIEDMKTINEKVGEVFTDTDGALIKAGFREKGIKLVVAEIRLPKGIEDVLPQIDRQRIEAEAAPFEAKQRAIETVGAIIQMMAEARGIPAKTIQNQIEADPILQREFLNRANDLIIRRMGIDGKSYVDIRVQGAEGVERTILNALAAWKRMPMGNLKKEEGEERKAKIRTPEELKKSTEQTKKEVKRIKKEKGY